MRIAFFSPLPPSHTGVAEYSLNVIEGLEAHHQVEAFTDEPIQPGRHSWRTFATRDLLEPYNLTVHHVGNSLHHTYIYPFVFHRPGILVLHDLVLHHSRLAMYMNTHEVQEYKKALHDVKQRDKARGRLSQYIDEVEAAYGEKGRWIAEVALEMGGGKLFYEYPLFELLIRTSKLTLVHSSSARDQILQSLPDARVGVVRMGIESPDPIPRQQARKALGLGDSSFLLASFGWVTPEKRIPAILRVVKRLLANGTDVRYLLVGRTAHYYDAAKEAQELGIDDRVLVTGEVSEKDFWLYVFASDLSLNLRYPTAAETSATLLRLLSARRTVIITNQIHMLEIPTSVVARVPLGDEDDGLFWLIKDFIRQPEKRDEIEAKARSYVESRHQIFHMVEDYLRYIDEANRLPDPTLADLPPHLAGLTSVWNQHFTRLSKLTGLSTQQLRRMVPGMESCRPT